MQPRPRGGWPTQPPRYSGAAGAAGYGQAGGPHDGRTRHLQSGYTQDDGYGRGGSQPVAIRRRRRGRGWIVLLIILAVLAGLAFIGDQVAKAYAQNVIAAKLESSSGLSSQPSVTIEGWPFLTQVAAHDIKAIDISANNVTTTGGKLPVNFTAKATGVHPNSSFNGATIDHITGQATITYRALDNYLGAAIGIPGLNAISFSPDPAKGPDAVKADAGIGSADATVTKTGPAQITIKFGSLSGIASLLGGAGSIPPQIIDIPKLPAGLVVGSPEVTSQGVVIPASASNTTLSQ